MSAQQKAKSEPMTPTSEPTPGLAPTSPVAVSKVNKAPAPDLSGMLAVELNFQPAEKSRIIFQYIMPKDVPFAATLQPTFWKDVVYKIKRNGIFGTGARIELMAADNSWAAELIVLQAIDNFGATVAVYKDQVYFNSQKDLPPLPHQLEVRLLGEKKHCVLLKASGAILKDELVDQVSAHEWALDYAHKHFS